MGGSPWLLPPTLRCTPQGPLPAQPVSKALSEQVGVGCCWGMCVCAGLQLDWSRRSAYDIVTILDWFGSSCSRATAQWSRAASLCAHTHACLLPVHPVGRHTARKVRCSLKDAPQVLACSFLEFISAHDPSQQWPKRGLFYVRSSIVGFVSMMSRERHSCVCQTWWGDLFLRIEREMDAKSGLTGFIKICDIGEQVCLRQQTASLLVTQ